MAQEEAPSRQTIAVVGASADRSKFGNKCVRAYRQAGWQVFPINPREGEIEGLETRARLAEVPVALDRVSVYLPPPVTLRLLDDIARRGEGTTFFNPGSADAAVVDRARELGLDFRVACSIVDIGLSPSQFP